MAIRAVFGLMVTIATATAFGGEIVLPSRALERGAPVRAVYRTGSLATGKGELSIRWTDVYGRIIDDRKIPFELTDESEVPFELDVRRAVAMQNDLSVHLSFDGMNKKGERDHREEDAQVSFIARLPDRKWWDYQIIMWQEYPPEQYAVLKTLGITAGQYGGKADRPPESLLRNDLRWYGENIATDFYSACHRWFPDRPVNWKFVAAKELYKKDLSSLEAFKRHPSLVDPAWLKRIHDRLIESVQVNSPYRPLFYNLGDETGIADLAAFWDFDFSDLSLIEMRRWLKERYGTLAALNGEWGTNFTSWDLVMPMTTNQAMKRADDNFSSWGDFKEWMDVSFTRALQAGADAVHSADPEAYVGLEGGQIPGWGGYDYSRLARVLDAMEPYDLGGNVDILRSLNPRMVVITTAFARGPWEKQRVWHELLHGNRGLILWDDKFQYVAKDGTVGLRGRETEPYFNELRKGIAALLINSQRQTDPIAIHYSQASLRVEWLLAQRPKNEAWVRRTSGTEDRDNDFMRLRESYCRVLEDLGRQFQFVDSGGIERGKLLRGGYQALFMPRSSAISEAEAKALREFVDQGGMLIADGYPGAFDEHGKRLQTSRLSELFPGPYTDPVTVRAFGKGKAVYLKVNLLNYYRDRLHWKEAETHGLIGRLLKENVSPPAYRVADDSGESPIGVEVQVFRNGGVDIVALQSNPQLSVEDLGPPTVISNQRFEKPRTVTLTLPGEFYLYDVRGAKALGKKTRLAVPLDPYEPSIFAVFPVAAPELILSAAAHLARGETGQIGFRFSAFSPAGLHVFYVEVVDPSGKALPQYSGNLLAPGGKAVKLLPLAVNDSRGEWEVQVRDLLSGQEKTSAVDVR